MENFLRDRIRSRLDALDLNPFEAARLIGAERTFINDLLIGKKATIRPKSIPKVAEVLDCDPEYLIGVQGTPRKIKAETATAQAVGTARTVPLIGIAELGTWRPAGQSGPPMAIPLPSDPRFPLDRQSAFIIRGGHADAFGLADGTIILALMGETTRDGDIVVARRVRQGDEGPEAETTIRRITGGQLEAVSRAGALFKIPMENAEIIARALSAHKIF